MNSESAVGNALSMEDRLRGHSLDSHAGYRAAAAGIKRLFGSGTGRKVLDVSGSGSFLGELLPDCHVSVADLGLAKRASEDLAPSGVGALSFSDGSFDSVASVDVLARIPKEQRRDYLAELRRVSRTSVVIVAPFASDEVIRQERMLAACYKSLDVRTPGWLEEHAALGLPDLNQTLETFRQAGFSVQVTPHGYLPHWATLKVLQLASTKGPAEQSLYEKLSQQYDESYQFDGREPAYRHVILASRGAMPRQAESPPFREDGTLEAVLHLAGIAVPVLAATVESEARLREAVVSLERQRAANREYGAELARIQSGLAWSLLMRYRNLLGQIAPPRSFRGRAYTALRRPFSRGAAPPKPRLSVRMRFWVRRIGTLLSVARMVIRTQGFVQLLRFTWRKLTRPFTDGGFSTGAATPRRPLERRVAIVIPTYEQTTLVSDCVDSIWESLSFQDREKVRIVIVDDGSRPEVQAALRKLPAEVVLKTRNEGYARGFNDGLATIPLDEDVIVLNNDTLAQEGWIEALQACAHSNPQVGVVGPKLLYPDGRIQSAGSYRSVGAPEWFDHCFRFRESAYLPANIQREVLAVTGACMYIKREVLEKIGGFDPEYPMAYEDVDYCLRAREAGFRILYCPQATLTHLEGYTRGERKEARELVAQERFWKLWGPHFEGRRTVGTSPDRLSVIYVMQDTGVGGGARVIFEHLNRLADRGHQVELYSLAERPRWFPLTVPVQTFGSYESLAAALAKKDAIKVATWWETGEFVWQASLQKGVPVFLVQDIETSYYGDEHAHEKARVMAGYRKEFHYIADASWTKVQLQQQFGVEATVVAPGIDETIYKPMDVVREKDVVLSVGRTNPLKNVELLLRAFPLVKSRASLWLFGIEPRVGKELTARYIFAPSDHGAAELYNQATVFVLTSIHEGFGLPILEAWACGCPVICTDADGNMDFCRDGENCIMVPRDDEKALASAIERVLGDVGLQESLRQAGFTALRDYTWSKSITDLETFFARVARDRSARLVA
jgi:GT2 family glycosyltransferase